MVGSDVVDGVVQNWTVILGNSRHCGRRVSPRLASRVVAVRAWRRISSRSIRGRARAGPHAHHLRKVTMQIPSQKRSPKITSQSTSQRSPTIIFPIRQERYRRVTQPWGTQVTAVEIKDLVLPDNMQRAMGQGKPWPTASIARRSSLPQGNTKPRWSSAKRPTSSRSAPCTRPPDDGGNLGRREFDHHFPSTIHDDGAGSRQLFAQEAASK